MTESVKELTDRAKSRADRPLTQPARGVSAFVEAFARLGYDVDDLLAAAGLTTADLKDPDTLLPCSTMNDFVGRAVQSRSLKNLPLRLAAETPIGASPLLDYLVLSSDTVGAAFRQLARYMSLVGSPIAFAFHEDENPVRVSVTFPGGVFFIEYTLALSVLHLRRETEDRFTVRSAHFAHRPDDAEEFERMLRCPVRIQDGWSGLSISPESWRLAMRRGDPVLRAMLERQAEKAERDRPAADLVSRLRRALAFRIAGGDTGIQSAARELATTARTLQRRLAEAGTSYQDVLEGMRREAAEGYLADSSLSVGEVGYLLGYSEPAAFHRAFKRWHGKTPVEFRRQRKRKDSLSACS